MSNFLPRHIKNIQGWIPETDIDGLDVGETNLFLIVVILYLRMDL